MDIQFKKGVIELCVLSMLLNEDRYGYELASVLSKKINISDGGIYPVLRRLKSEESVETYLSESSEGPPRKYYRLTKKGDRQRQGLEGDWQVLRDGVDSIVKGEKIYE